MIIIAPGPMPLISLIADPISGDVKIQFTKYFADLYGPAYAGICRQQLEQAAKVMSAIEIGAESS